MAAKKKRAKVKSKSKSKSTAKPKRVVKPPAKPKIPQPTPASLAAAAPFFPGVDLADFWLDSEYEFENYTEELTDEKIALVETRLGLELPASYVALMATRNGGSPKNTFHAAPNPTSWAKDHVAMNAFWSIGETKMHSILGMLGHVDYISGSDAPYPDIGLYIADCPSGGHDAIALDYRACGPKGEPSVVHVDQDYNYKITKLASSFADFIRGLKGPGAFPIEE